MANPPTTTFALVKGGIVINVIVADQAFIAQEVKDGVCDFGILIDPNKVTVNNGDLYLGDGTFQSSGADEQTAVTYIPKVEALWQSVPATMQEALDELVTRVKNMGG